MHGQQNIKTRMDVSKFLESYNIIALENLIGELLGR